MLHMEIIQQRLESEADIDLIQTAPNVTYEMLMHERRDDRASTTRRTSPTPARSRRFREPIARVNFILPAE